MADKILENQLSIESPGYYKGPSPKESHDLIAKPGFKVTTWDAFLERTKFSIWDNPID
jgi:hypothetical protein